MDILNFCAYTGIDSEVYAFVIDYFLNCPKNYMANLDHFYKVRTIFILHQKITSE